mmetsp:Transcript_15005/g.44428  ORF Transcript_15005/g.44428 Transcript_15005/m.44428 type:complete len:272 (-) Transcript_15005:7-822(-)
MIWVLFSANLFVAPLSVIFDTFANIYVRDLFYDGDKDKGTQLFSHCVAVIGVCLLIIPMILYEPFKRCVGFNGTIVIGGVTIIIGLIGNGAATTPTLFLLSTAVWASGFQLLGPAIPVLITRLADPTAFGRAFGFFMSFGNFSRMAGPSLMAPVFNWKRNWIFYGMAASISVMAMILLGVAIATTPPAAAQGACQEEEDVPASAPQPAGLARVLSGATSDAAMMFGNLPGQAPWRDKGLARSLQRARTVAIAQQDRRLPMLGDRMERHSSA